MLLEVTGQRAQRLLCSGIAVWQCAKRRWVVCMCSGFTKTVALETAQAGNVTCNAICPGYVLTDLIRNQLEDTAKARGIPKVHSYFPGPLQLFQFFRLHFPQELFALIAALPIKRTTYSEVYPCFPAPAQLLCIFTIPCPRFLS